jgi:Right handed beta helix region
MNIRKKLLRTTMVVAAGLITCFAATQAQANTIYVGSCHAGGKATITAALAVATPGSIIDVCPGYYPEQVFIVGSGYDNITIQGIAYTSMGTTTDAAVIIPPSGGMVQKGTIIDPDEPGPALPQIYVNGATGVTISHITVDALGNTSCNGNLIGIYYQDASGTVTDSTARNQNEGPGNGDQCGWGIAIESDSSAYTLTVTNSSVHNFQKNGIVARGNGSVGPTLTATGNTVIGVGPVPGIAAQNGIEVAFSATGTVKTNYVADMLYPDNTSNGTGILFYSTSGAAPTASGNVVESSNVGIGSYSSNDASITSNHIGGSQMLDGIDLCSTGETAKTNTIYNSTTAGINLESAACGAPGATEATVTGNTINEACTGILTGTGAAGDTTAPNTYFNVFTEVAGGGTCTPPALPGNAAVKAASKTEGKAGKVRP